MTVTQVRATTVTLRGATLGAESTLPAYAPVRPGDVPTVDPSAPAAMRERVARGTMQSPLPYGLMSDYDRGEDELSLPGVELTNGKLAVTVLPSLGGRVWSCVDLTRDRELLHVPDSLRYAGFGLTDAWFAGGIEWNLGTFGHSAMTTRAMHAAVVPALRGGTGLRLWEWERSRDLIYLIDLWLDGPRLMASTRVINPDPEDKPLYWWTNIAVPETDGTRVLVPATHAWRTDYRGELSRVAVPRPGGDLGDADVSRPTASTFAADYFYEVEDQTGRLLVAAEADGRGFAQTSTAALRGRKLFLWGHGPGGRRWQRHLGGARCYVEIQAGVCPTQLEYDLLPAGAAISWTECFLGVDLQPEDVAGDYAAASETARAQVHAQVDPAALEALHREWLETVAEGDPGEVLSLGSGWGHVELALRELTSPAGVNFPSVEDGSRVLLPLTRGETVVADPARPPLPGVSTRWRAAIGAAAERADAGWWPVYARGVLAHLDGDHDAARRDYARSLDLSPSAVAARGLALLTGDVDAADRLLEQACALAPEERRVVTERLERLLGAGEDARAVEVVERASEAVRRHGRTRLLLAQAYAGLGERERAATILTDLEVEDLAEGDNSTARLWQAVCPGEPVPEHLDFRMTRDTDLTGVTS